MMSIETWLASNKRRITLLAFWALFLIRVIAGYISATQREDIAPDYQYFYFTASLIIIAIFVLANKDDLSKFNIDKYVVYTLILSSVVLFLSFGFSFFGIIAIISALLVRKVLYIPKTEAYKTSIFLVILSFTILGVAPEILLKLFLPESLRYPNYYLDFSAGEIIVFVSLRLWDVMFEEMLFRSILWGIMLERNIDIKKIVVTQAFLFWLVHLDGIITPSYAIPILIFGIWTGFLVLRSKSLIPSIATHVIHNLTSRLV